MSLIELIIAMGLAMLIIGSVVIKNDIGYLSTDQIARQLCSDIRYIKMKSVSGKRKYIIKFIKINNQNAYQILGDNGIEKTVKLKKGIQILGNTKIIKFRADATPEKGCTINIIYKNKRCRYRCNR